jgi:WD40 repeat protein
VEVILNIGTWIEGQLTDMRLITNRKGGSFLSRFSMRTPWMKDEDGFDSDSEFGEARDEGANARALTTVVGAGGGGYIPFFKEPPRYIRVSRRNKKQRDFNRLFLAQELRVRKPEAEHDSSRRAPATGIGSKLIKGSSAIWAAEFSLDGKFLAVAGKDAVVRIFSVISTPEERQAHEEEEATDCGNGEKLSAPVFRNKPVREYEGHTEQVLALSWSKNGFLLSCSMDKTVRLWHPSRPECLCAFQHNDLVTSIAFHPTDDRFFLAGSLDAELRLWSIPDKSVAFSATTAEFQTAVGFSPDGKTAICGLLSGMCMFFETEGLQMQYQIHVRSSRGKNAKGSKITGIRTWLVQEGPEKGDAKVLISSNDSRIRTYSLKTRMLESKFRGHTCQSSQIHARLSDDGKYIIAGSEDKKAYIWGPTSTDTETRDKQPHECFDAHPEVVTVALMAPTASRQLLSASGDPIYDLCNPPPVTLVSLEESQAALSDGESQYQSSMARKPEESPAYIERSKHCGGNIIITTDRTGTIKVFRQDCAHAKRQQNMWETGSKFSGKLASGVGRSSSIRTKGSISSNIHSRRGSLSLAPNPSQQQPVSDRILSWRQDVDGGRRVSRNVTPARSERSLSPSKAKRISINTSAAYLGSDGRREPDVSSPVSADSVPSVPGSPGSSTYPSSSRTPTRLPKIRPGDEDSTMPPTPSFSFLSVADSRDSSREGSFWNLSRWRGNQNLKPSASGSLSPSTSAYGSLGRKSLNVNDIRRLQAEDVASRRASSGARLPSLKDAGSTAQSIDERLEDSIHKTPPANNHRDSGVGRISTESADQVEHAK